MKYRSAPTTAADYLPSTFIVMSRIRSPAEAAFNFELYKEHIGLAQSMMDDIIDLELEKIDAILAKIEGDPEPEELKHAERKPLDEYKEEIGGGKKDGDWHNC